MRPNEEPEKSDPPKDLTGALRTLRHDSPPPPDLEDRIVARLLGDGLIRLEPSRRRSVLRRLAIGLAAVSIFVAGIATGRLATASFPRNTAHQSESAQWALLLHEGEPTTSSHEAERIAVVVDWLRTLRAQGIAIDGQPLANDSWWIDAHTETQGASLPTSPGQVDRLTGFLLLDGVGLEQALEIARNAPFRLWNVRIELRPIGAT